MDSNKSLKKSPRVIIVGAGIAGVGVARKLMQLGFTDILIIEASSQAGGRIRGSPFGKSVVDEGAQYIHGASVKNPIFQLAKEHNLLQEGQSESESKWALFSSSQKQLDPDFRRQMQDVASRVLKGAHLLARGERGMKAQSMAEVYCQEVKKLIEEWAGDSAELKRQKLGLLSLAMKWQCIHLAAKDLGDVSAFEYQEYRNIEGPDRNFHGSFPSLLQKLLKPVPKERLQLGKPIKQIMWNGSFQSEDGTVYPVRVQCEDGDQFLADHVIVTVSLGCLKAKGRSLFRPSLPEEKLQAIKSLGFGTMNKIYLEYEAPFWEEDVDIIGLVWEDESPLSGQKTNLAEWWRRVAVLYVFQPVERYGHVLVATISGKEAEYVESMNPEEVASDFTKLLRQFTGRPSLPEPKSVFVTKWHTNSYTQGSYTYISVDSTGEAIDTLAEPLPQREAGLSIPALQVLFAGEATHRSFHSTTHGALLSGWREAERLAHHYTTSEGQ